MMYTIVQSDPSDRNHEIAVRAFEDKEKAVCFLARLARKQQWAFRKGNTIDRYIDSLNDKEYYITQRDIG